MVLAAGVVMAGCAVGPTYHRPEPAPVVAHDVPLVTDEDRATFGTELIDLATRIAKQTVAPDLAAIRGETAVTVTGEGEAEVLLFELG